MKAVRTIIRTIDSINGSVGSGVKWLTLLLVLITVYDVVMRYIFHAGSVYIQELEWHLFAANFMLAAGWTLLNEGHVRVDFFYARLSNKKKAWIDFLGSIIFCLPYCMLVIWASWPLIADSWSIWEGSPDPGGLPARYLLRTVIPVAFLLLGLQAIVQAVKSFFIIVREEEKS